MRVHAQAVPQASRRVDPPMRITCSWPQQFSGFSVIISTFSFEKEALYPLFLWLCASFLVWQSTSLPRIVCLPSRQLRQGPFAHRKGSQESHHRRQLASLLHISPGQCGKFSRNVHLYLCAVNAANNSEQKKGVLSFNHVFRHLALVEDLLKNYK